MADALRASAYYKALPPPSTRDGKWHPAQQPVFFEQRYSVHNGGAAGAADATHSLPDLLLSWVPPPPPLGALLASIVADDAAAADAADADADADADDAAAAAYGSKFALPPPPPLPPPVSVVPPPLSASPAAVPPLGVHLIIFVHGYHGNAYDLRTMRGQLALALPNKDRFRYLCSASNEEHTAHASFETLGANLAVEIIEFMRSENILQTCSRLSFVCHSFGAIIGRVALSRPDLEPLRPLLHTYLSFSGPHLGMLYGTNTLVELGMWGLRRWKKAQCLTELSLKDKKEPSETLLYRLSKQPVLALFTNVLFVSSVEDRYVPHHSARLQLCDEAVHDTRNGPVFASMVHNLLGPLIDSNLLHIEVHFGEPPEDKLLARIDAAIGRTAHISFLDNDPFVRMFVHTYLAFFA